MKKRSILFLTLILVLTIYFNRYTSTPPSPEVNSNSGQISAGDVLKVHFIDVGQGDAILVQTPDGQNMLVDAGDNSYGDEVVDYLESQGVAHLDIVVGTHTHADHIGGLDTVINNVSVGSIYMPRVTQNTKSFRDVLTAIADAKLKVQTAKAGVALPLEGVDGRFVAPVEDSYESLNNYSAVIKLEYGSHSFLLTGDAERESENQILDSGADLQSTVLKVGHHGSRSSTTSKFLNTVKPQFGVIMLAQDNEYGHPHEEVLNRLNKAGVKLYRTDLDGTIIFSSDGNDLQITSAKSRDDTRR